MSQLTTIFMDFDGTLVESLTILKAVYLEFFSLNKLATEKCTFEELKGPTLAEIVNIIIKRFQLICTPEKLLAQYQSILLDKCLQANPMPGSLDFLVNAKENKAAVYIVTSNNKKPVQDWLNYWNVSQYIDGLITADDVKVGKPNPEPYLLAIESAGCSIDTAIAIEDSFQGATAAANAKLKTFCFKNKENEPYYQYTDINWVDDYHSLKRWVGWA